MELINAYRELGKEMIPYFRKYTHDLPIIMSHPTYQSTKMLGKVLHKAILYIVAHYSEFLDIMPLSDRDLRVLEIASKYSFRTGTYRTDFVFDESKSIKIIEMTTRQPLNGYVISGFTNAIGQQMAQEMHLQGVVNDYDQFLNFMQQEFVKTGKLTVVKGNERLGDFKIYERWFTMAGLNFNVVSPDELSGKLHLLHNATVLEELNHAEICALPDALIDELCAAGIFNDFRNLFLIHDKRFFALLTEPVFLEKALAPDEITFLQTYMVPTYTVGRNPDQFEQARLNPGQWILKSTRFGKSEGIYAGCVTPAQEWKALFDPKLVEHMVLQPLISQYKFKGTIGEEVREDYVAGTLLYFDDDYYGPGIYRASSFVVTNVKDDRKLAQVVAQQDDTYSGITI